MPATWPASLPQYLRIEGYSEGMADGRLISETDTGPAKIRLRSSAMPRPMRGNMVMSGTQLDALHTFVDDEIMGGSLVFEMPNRRGTGDPHLVRFVSMPVYSSMGADLWMVELDLEILP